MDSMILAVAATFGATFIAGAVAVSTVMERRRVSSTLRALPTSELSPASLRDRTLAIPAVDRLVRPFGRRLFAGVRRLTPVAQLERFEEKLVIAGRPAGWDPARLAAIRLVGRVVVPLGLYFLLSVAGLPRLQVLVMAFMGGFAMHLGPDVVLDGIIRRRQLQTRIALPDTIDLLTITVEAGLGFDAALDRVGRTTAGPLGEELRRTVQDVQLGRPRAEALRGLSERVGLPEMRSLTSALVQAEQFGITIGSVLRSQAAELRERRRQSAEEHAQRIPIKILVPLIFCILPAVFVVLVGPGGMQIVEAFSE